MLEPLDRALGADEANGTRSPEDHAQKMFEAAEVVEVSMAQQNVAHPKELARWKTGEGAEIAENGTTRTHEIGQECRIAGRPVDEREFEGTAHRGMGSARPGSVTEGSGGAVRLEGFDPGTLARRFPTTAPHAKRRTAGERGRIADRSPASL